MRNPGPHQDARRRLPFLVVTLIAALVAAAAFRGLQQRRTAGASTTARPPLPVVQSSLTPEVLAGFTAIENQERQALLDFWPSEAAAQAWADRIDDFWNHLNRHRGTLPPLLQLPARSITLPPPTPVANLPFDILHWQGARGQPLESLQPSDPRLASWLAEGWGLDQSEWRHIAFSPADPLPTSTYDIHLHLSRSSPPARASIHAHVRIQWPSPNPAPGTPQHGDWEVLDWQLLRRDGPPAFSEEARIEITPFPRTTWIDPLLAITPPPPPLPPTDRSFILAARNLRVTRSPDGDWSASTLTPHHPGLLFTATLADFTGDGVDDLLCVVRSGVVVLPGSPGHTFDNPPFQAWTAPQRLAYAQALTCGDIDGDGDLDVFIGQYRPPYESGQMPRPFYDALDGPPAYLLRNTGTGRFEDITADSGLAPKRHRRSYAASFADLDNDGDPDLLVTSDFAGVDVHANDGSGRFLDRTPDWIDEPRAFGMSHLFSDFNADGLIDLFVAGMPQPTADRLGALGLERPGHEPWAAQRSRITTGNRLYLAGPTGFRQPDAGAGSHVARAGWAWSATDLDLDNDRFPEIHVVNGHETRASVRDYEPEFWLHDIYVGDSTPRPSVEAYFASKFTASRSRGWSYGGYDKNRLFLNLAGTRFVEAAHMLGLALEADSRNVLADDFDGDGDSDLLVTTHEVWPKPRQTLLLLRNDLPPQGRWIEIQPVPGPSLPGTTVTLTDSRGSQRRILAWGAGYRSQPAAIARFGLGDAPEVQTAEVRWPNGSRSTATNLAPNRRHAIHPPTPADRPQR